MRVRNLSHSLTAWRAFSANTQQVSKSVGFLSSGLRINRAADDGMGLGIAERFNGQIRGLVQANRNALDGLSLLDTAESSLVEIQNLLQRGRELSVQAANGTLTDEDRQYLQVEMEHILKEIDRIADAATFNSKRLLSTSGKAALTAQVIAGLQSGWLEQSAHLIRTHYGLEGTDDPIRIVLHPNGHESTWLIGIPGENGELTQISLNINLEDFDGPPSPDGGTGPVFNDRKVARALTQALIAVQTSYVNLDRWFVSGASDYIPGADELLTQVYRTMGANAIIDAIDSWEDRNPVHRAASYLAVKFLDRMMLEQANGFTMSDIFDHLKAGNSLSSALEYVVSMTTDAFVSHFKAYGADYLALLESEGVFDDNDTDVGAIGGGNPVTSVPNGGTFPVPGYNFVIDVAASHIQTEIKLQVGANIGDIISVYLPEITTFSLGLFGINLRIDATNSIIKLDEALSRVSDARSLLGSASNRLHHTIHANQNAHEQQQAGMSRIKDLDYAQQMASLTRQQILVQTSGAMLAQANTLRQNVMWLLRGLDMIQPRTQSSTAHA